MPGIAPDINNLESWWRLDEDGGTAYDTHGYNHLTQHGGTIPRSGGKVGYSRNFEKDSTHYLQGGWTGFMPFSNYSIGMWIKPESIGTTMNILYSPDHLRLRITSGGILEASIYDPYDVPYWAAAQYGTPLLPATWNFITLVIDSKVNITELFLRVNNGTHVGTSILTNIGGNYYAETIYVGSNATPANYYDGKLDEMFRFYGALTDDEQDWLYNDGIGRSYDDLKVGGAVGSGIMMF